MSKRKLPYQIPGTIRHWRTRKRRELDAVLRAMDMFRFGCAYTPARDIGVICDMLRDNRRKMSVKEWK